MRVKRIWSRRIWSDGKHNAFPGFVRFGDWYYVAFRYSAGHQNPRGTIRVIRCRADDLERWEQTAEFDVGGDARDPFSIVIRRQLCVYFHRSEDWLACSADGLQWSKPRELDTEFPAPPRDCKLEFTSKRKWHFRIRPGPDGFLYSLARCGLASNGNPGILLYRSEDGIAWKAMHTFGEGIQKTVNNGHETDLAFMADGTAVAAARIAMGDGGGTGMICTAAPPYLNWDAYWTGVRNFGGPALWRTPQGLLLAARSYPAHGGAGCTIWEVTPAGLIAPFILPSGGDCAYQTFADGPNGEILLCYYSSHEWPWAFGADHPADLYLARIEPAQPMTPSF